MILKTEIIPLKQVIDNKIEKDDSLALRVRTLQGDEESGIYTPVKPDEISFFVTDTNNNELYDFQAMPESFYMEEYEGVYTVILKAFEAGNIFFRVEWSKNGIKKIRKYALSVLQNIPSWQRGI